jgi:hypothetical protein
MFGTGRTCAFAHTERTSFSRPLLRRNHMSVSELRQGGHAAAALATIASTTERVSAVATRSTPESMADQNTPCSAGSQTTPSRLSSTYTPVTLRDLVAAYLGTGSSSALALAARAAVARTARSVVDFAWTHTQAGSLAALLISAQNSHPSDINNPAAGNCFRTNPAVLATLEHGRPLR